MRSKKFFSMVTALTLTASMFVGITAKAAVDVRTSVGTRLNFEDAFASSDAQVYKTDDEYNGGVLKLDGANAQMNYYFGEKTSSGKYRFGFDMKKSSGKELVLFAKGYNKTTDSWGQRSLVKISGNGFSLDTDGTWNFSSSLAQNVYTPGDWARVDFVFDWDEDWAEFYLNGELKGEFTPSAYSLYGMEGMVFLNTDYDKIGTSVLIDNLEYVKADGTETLKPALSTNGDLMYIDFNAPAKNVTKDSFTVTKQTNPLAGAASDEAFDIVYAGSTRAVLKLASAASAGARYSVVLNGVLSYQDAEPQSTTLAYTVPMSDVVNEVINVNLADYTKDNLFENTPFSSGNKDKISVDEYGVVVNSGSKFYCNFPSITAGKAEMEITFKTDFTVQEGSNAEVGYAKFVADNAQGTYATYYMGQVHTVNGFVFPMTKIINGREYIWNNRGYASGSEVVLKGVLDVASKKMDIYYNGNLVVSAYPWNADGGKEAEAITGAKGVELEALAGGTVHVKNIKVTQTYTPCTLGDVKFADALGNETPVTAVSSATKQIKISFPSGLANDTFDGTISLKANGEDVAFTGEYDAANKVYTMNLDKLLGANATYEMKISGGTSTDGKIYSGAEGTFTTDSGVTDFRLNKIEKTSTGVKVDLGCINTAEDAEYYVIWAGYDGNGKMITMDYKPLTVEQNSAQTQRSFEFESDKAAGCAKLTAFIWQGFDKITPVTPSIDG